MSSRVWYGYSKCCALCCANTQGRHTTQGLPTVHVVVKPLYGHTPHKILPRVAFFVDHYAALGFNNTILYERGTYIRHLHMHDATAKQLHQGSLKVCCSS